MDPKRFLLGVVTALTVFVVLDFLPTMPFLIKYAWIIVISLLVVTIAGIRSRSGVTKSGIKQKEEPIQPLPEKGQDEYVDEDADDADSGEETTLHELERRRQAMDALYKISLATSSLLEVDDLLEFIVDLSLKIILATHGSIMLIDKQSQTMTIRTAIGLDPEIMKKVVVQVGEGISGWVAHTGEPLLITDLDRDERFHHEGDKKYDTKYETTSLISCPLKVKDNIIGVININNKQTGEAFDKYDLELLTILANYASVAIETATLHEEINNHYVSIIGLATRALEAKDPYTLGHSERVTQYAVDLAEKMGLPRDDVRIIRQAGILHDIGKIGISESILLKKGRLTDEEFEAIKRHPIIGSTIIEPMNVLPGVCEAIMYHHERYDGYGYPEKLKGENIPLAARVLCVADSFDAMTSTRPYRPALPNHVVINELKKNKSKQFDPDALEAFLIILKERKYYTEEELAAAAEKKNDDRGGKGKKDEKGAKDGKNASDKANKTGSAGTDKAESQRAKDAADKVAEAAKSAEADKSADAAKSGEEAKQ